MNAAESDRLIRQLGDLGVRPGATVLVHSSFKALGCRDLSPAQVIDALNERIHRHLVFMVAVLPQFLTDARPLWLQLLVMAATSVVIDLTVMHGYALGASSLRRALATSAPRRASS